MNRLQIKIQEVQVNELNQFVTKILIDGTDLIVLLSEFEKPFAKKEGCPDIAGQYGGLNPRTLYKNLLNLTDNSNSNNNKSDILDCDCGVWGCWAFMTKIENVNNKIIWTDFEQLHRGKDSHNHWNYSKFGPFEFNKSEYNSELEKLRNQL
ncbi:hypothetical protein [uncultured Psychroserpens sp.]|uniref:hypothetical protein n=1 Tax=uncultured Psychroserpens sp. TaxID=255436 RepID=UPI002624656C|nr:hypothetical protein [uncultured Psychroserpens sp.]